MNNIFASILTSIITSCIMIIFSITIFYCVYSTRRYSSLTSTVLPTDNYPSTVYFDVCLLDPRRNFSSCGQCAFGFAMGTSSSAGSGIEENGGLILVEKL